MLGNFGARWDQIVAELEEKAPGASQSPISRWHEAYVHEKINRAADRALATADPSTDDDSSTDEESAHTDC